MREGDHSKHITQAIEVWKGRYKDEVVALKVFKVPRRGPHTLEFQSVSMPRSETSRGSLFVVLTCDSCSAAQ